MDHPRVDADLELVASHHTVHSHLAGNSPPYLLSSYQENTMPNSLLTGVSGLIAHQRLLDVVGHNLANMNTTAFKSQRILFADLLYETIQPATSSNDGASGGTNPNQIGGGVKAAGTDRRFGQGALENTGGEFDFAISGGGFFSVTDGDSDFYTRAGAFSLDEQGFIVTPDGLHLKRFSSAGEPDGINPGFQIPGDPRIQIPLGASVEGSITNTVEVVGNLTAKSSPPIPQTFMSAQPFTVAGVDAVGTDTLNSFDTVTTPYAVGDRIVIEGTLNDGSAQVFAEYTVTATSTLQDLVDAINAEYTDATARIDQGNLIMESDLPGNSQLNLTLRNQVGNVGEGIPLGTHQLQLTTEGEEAGTAATIVTVYDIQGGAHELTIKFAKKTDDSWTMNVAVDPGEGVMLDGVVDNIMFNDSGDLVGSETPTVTMQLNGIAVPQTITFDFGNASSAAKLSHFNADSSVSATSDGSAPGVLTGVQVDANGEIKGVASNGKVFTMAKFAITGFSNPKGLVAVGDNLFIQSLNSGQPDIGEAGTGGRGLIRGGQLEASNVDVANEFTKLIVAQTGYNANARTITISAELLEELTNIIR